MPLQLTDEDYVALGRVMVTPDAPEELSFPEKCYLAGIRAGVERTLKLMEQWPSESKEEVVRLIRKTIEGE